MAKSKDSTKPKLSSSNTVNLSNNLKTTKPAKPKRTSKKTKLPGSVYLNKNRYWWKVKLPGESKISARPLVPVGARYATKDPAIAKEVAANLLQQAIYSAENATSQPGDRSIMSIVKAFSVYAKNYYYDAEEKRNVSNGERELNERYDRRTYRKAVQYAIKKAQKAGDDVDAASA
jgi:hypothetical protein